MARRKQVAPMQRINSGEIMQALPNQPEHRAMYSNGHIKRPTSSFKALPSQSSSSQASIFQLLICVGGIYATFLTWGILQERITTTPFHPMPESLRTASVVEYFKFPIFLNSIQSLLACVSGGLYLLVTSPSDAPLLPSASSLPPLLLITLTSTLASPFGYASLHHVDYLTFVLAKSCKLLPVMLLHILLYRKKYRLSKYAIVLSVTAGVAIFTLYHPPKSRKPSASTNSLYGLALLAINLLFDGLTNTTQDHIFSSFTRYGHVTAPQMMVIVNFLSLILMSAYLLLTPIIPPNLLPTMISTSSTHELSDALSFLERHPSVTYDILSFCLAGAVGQLFIFATLNRFGSLLLVTVTVTRKMLTMLLSVVWYGKSLTRGQWAGVALVFGGIGTEAWLARKEKLEKDRRKREGSVAKEQ